MLLDQIRQKSVLRGRYPSYDINYIGGSRRAKYILKHADDQLIVCITDSNQQTTPNEVNVLKALRNEIAIPEVIDEFVQNKERYLICKLVHGEKIEERLKDSDAQTSRSLGEFMGSVLQRLHSVNIKTFSNLKSPGDFWWKWLKCLQPNLMIPKSFTSKEPVLAFVHNDFVPHNILLLPGVPNLQLASVIDFEWSFVGDPMWDVGYFEWWVNTGGYKCPKEVWEGFLKGYGRAVKPSEMKFYAKLRRPGSKWWTGDNRLAPPLCWI